MILEIDHILIAVPDPAAAAADLAGALGLAPAGGGVHEAIGTRNALLNLGGPYLELIGLTDADSGTRDRALGHPIGAAVVRALDAIAAGGPGPYAYVTLALRTDDMAGDLALLRAAGRGTGVAPAVVERRRPDGSLIRWQVAFPPRLGPAEAPFLIEHAPDEPERVARVAAGGPALDRLVVPMDRPDLAARAWRDGWGLVPAQGAAAGSAVISVGADAIVFVDARTHPGPVAVRLAALSSGAARTVDRGGVAIDLV